MTTAVGDLHPSYFAFVMATGIISTGTFLLGPSWLSRALLAATSAGLVVLGAALAARLVFLRSGVAAAIAAWALVAAAFLAPLARHEGQSGSGRPAVPGTTTTTAT